MKLNAYLNHLEEAIQINPNVTHTLEGVTIDKRKDGAYYTFKLEGHEIIVSIFDKNGDKGMSSIEFSFDGNFSGKGALSNPMITIKMFSKIINLINYHFSQKENQTKLFFFIPANDRLEKVYSAITKRLIKIPNYVGIPRDGVLRKVLGDFLARELKKESPESAENIGEYVKEKKGFLYIKKDLYDKFKKFILLFKIKGAIKTGVEKIKGKIKKEINDTTNIKHEDSSGRMFKIGDRIKITRNCEIDNVSFEEGERAIFKHIARNKEDFGLEFPNKEFPGHNLQGALPAGNRHGWYFNPTQMASYTTKVISRGPSALLIKKEKGE